MLIESSIRRAGNGSLLIETSVPSPATNASDSRACTSLFSLNLVVSHLVGSIIL